MSVFALLRKSLLQTLMCVCVFVYFYIDPMRLYLSTILQENKNRVLWKVLGIFCEKGSGGFKLNGSLIMFLRNPRELGK